MKRCYWCGNKKIVKFRNTVLQTIANTFWRHEGSGNFSQTFGWLINYVKAWKSAKWLGEKRTQSYGEFCWDTQRKKLKTVVKNAWNGVFQAKFAGLWIKMRKTPRITVLAGEYPGVSSNQNQYFLPLGLTAIRIYMGTFCEPSLLKKSKKHETKPRVRVRTRKVRRRASPSPVGVPSEPRCFNFQARSTQSFRETCKKLENFFNLCHF